MQCSKIAKREPHDDETLSARGISILNASSDLLVWYHNLPSTKNSPSLYLLQCEGLVTYDMGVSLSEQNEIIVVNEFRHRRRNAYSRSRRLIQRCSGRNSDTFVVSVCMV
jgi:hypothetical protein